jgi:hypothetical protein
VNLTFPGLRPEASKCRRKRVKSIVDDSGYEILGLCCHPRIGMELFQPQKLDLSKADRCPLFVRQPVARPDGD